MFMCIGQLFSHGASGQFLADTGTAALGADVVLELVAEMPQRGEHRVRRRLAETAERGIADHPAQFVEFRQILLAALRPW